VLVQIWKCTDCEKNSYDEDRVGNTSSRKQIGFYGVQCIYCKSLKTKRNGKHARTYFVYPFTYDIQIFGDDEGDTLVGGIDDDLIVGRAGDDRLFGDEGNDVLEGDAGGDYFDCGEGIDIVLGFNPAEGDIIKNDCETS
jgi:Ca2+-binding RTX toxin-like protein